MNFDNIPAALRTYPYPDAVRGAGQLAAARVVAAQVRFVADLFAVLPGRYAGAVDHVAPAVGTDQKPAEQRDFAVLRGAGPVVFLLDFPAQVPGRPVDDRLVHTLHANPFLLRLAHRALVLVGHGALLTLHDAANIRLVAQHIPHRNLVPQAVVLKIVGPVLALRPMLPRRENVLGVEELGDAVGSVALAAPGKDAAHNCGGGLVDQETVLVCGVLLVAVGRAVAHEHAVARAGPLHRFDFLACVPALEFVEKIPERHDVVVIVDGVHPVIQGNEPAADHGE